MENNDNDDNIIIKPITNRIGVDKYIHLWKYFSSKNEGEDEEVIKQLEKDFMIKYEKDRKKILDIKDNEIIPNSELSIKRVKKQNIAETLAWLYSNPYVDAEQINGIKELISKINQRYFIFLSSILGVSLTILNFYIFRRFPPHQIKIALFVCNPFFTFGSFLLTFNEKRTEYFINEIEKRPDLEELFYVNYI